MPSQSPRRALDGMVDGQRRFARGVVFLAAEESAFISGITLSINGGKYMA